MTPGFPGYISGHSTFSRAAAEAMTAYTGSKWFPHGLGSYALGKLVNEAGPSESVTLQWASYFDAADQVGLSRIWGGIHPPADDAAGRRVGSQAGLSAWALAKKYFDGSIAGTVPWLATRRLEGGDVELRYEAVRGLYYRVESSADVTGPFQGAEGVGKVATENVVVSTQPAAGAQKFYRVAASLQP